MRVYKQINTQEQSENGPFNRDGSLIVLKELD